MLKNKWSVAILILLFFGVPLVFVNNFNNSFELPKILLSRMLILVSFLTILLISIRNKKLKINTSILKTKPVIILLGIYILFYFSTLFSDASIQSLYGSYERQQGFIQWTFYILLFLELILFLDRKQLIYLLLASIAAGVLLSVYGLLQYYGIELFFKNFETNQLASRVFASLGAPTFLGQFLTPLIPITLSLIFIYKNKIIKSILMIFLILFFCVNLLTYTRATLFGLIVAAMAFLIWFFINKKPDTRKIGKIILIILVVSTTIYLLAWQRLDINDYNTRSFKTRLNIWESAVSLIVDHPLLGTGLETFELYFPEYVGKDYYYYEEGLNFIADRPHNELLEMGVSGGVLTIIGYLALIIWIFYKYLKNNDILLHGILSSFIVIIVSNQFTFQRVSHYLLFILILAGSAILTDKKNRIKTIKITNKFAAITAAAILIISTMIINKLIVAPYLAEAAFSEYQTTKDANKIEEAISITPYNSYYRHEMLGNELVNYEEQIFYLKQIEGNTINSSNYRAVLESSRNVNKAIKIFEENMSKNPQYPITILYYADCLYDNKLYEEAFEKYEIFLETIPEFWKWNTDIENRSDYEKKQYEVFISNSPDFIEILKKYHDSSRQTQIETQLLP